MPMDDAPDMSAAELVLGLLDGDERSAALRRVLADRAFAREVEAWRRNMATLLDTVLEEAPTSTLLDRIEASLDAPAPAVTVIRSTAASSRVWQYATALAGFAAAACFALLVLQPTPKPTTTIVRSSPVMVTQLAAAGTKTTVTVVYAPDQQTLRVARNGAPFAQVGQGEELWVIAGNAAPRSLGMVGRDRANLQLRPKNGALIREGATIAISIELPSGSPTGAPTGPVVATGTVVRA